MVERSIQGNVDFLNFSFAYLKGLVISMIAQYCTDFLNELQLGDKGRPGSLRHLTFVIGENEYNAAKNAPKEQVVSLLSEYYCAPNRFEELWKRLSDAERKITSLHIWSAGSEPTNYADEIAKEFGVTDKKDRTSYHYYYSSNGLDKFMKRYAEDKSKLWLLFPRSSDSRVFRAELRDAVGEMKRVYSRVPKHLVFSACENRSADFANIVRFANSNRLIALKNGLLSKPSALKLWDFCGYEEYAADIKAKPEDVRTSDSLLVTLPMIVLCTVGGLLAVTEGAYVPGGKSLSLLDLPHEQLTKKLFEAYVQSKSFDEISMMKGIKSKRGHSPVAARQNLAGELKYCPPGQPIYTKEFERYLRIAAKSFARKDERYVVETGNSYYSSAVEWAQYEHPLINIILSFFGALGIIDIAWGENKAVQFDIGRRTPVAFRINPLGAHILGLSSEFSAPIDSKAKMIGGFTLLPDYTVIVPDSPNRLKHEIYFEKLLTKVSSTDEAVTYKLDFETMVRVIDSGVSIASLRKYLSASDKPIPDNVARALADWEKQSSRIRIRQVTILECDNAALLEEVLHYKGVAELVKDRIPAAIVVDGSATKKIKKAIEKNKRFCKDVV